MRLNYMVKGTLLQLLCALLLINGWSIQAQNESISQQKELLNSIDKQIDDKNPEAAQLLIDEAFGLNSSENDLFAVKLNYYQAEIFLLNENDEKALELLLDGYSKLESQTSTKFDVKYVETIGRIFSRAKNFEKSLKYFKEGIAHSIVLNDSVFISSLYLNAGSVFQNLRQMDSAEAYYKKVLQYHPKHLTSDETLATVYINLIGVAIGKGDFVLAEVYGKESIELHEKRNDTIKLAGALANMGSLNMYTQNLEASKDYYIRTLELLDDRKDSKSREVVVITLDNLSQVYYLQGDYKTGYDYLFESVYFNQDLINENLANKITEIDAKYNVEQKEKNTEIEKQKRRIAEILLYVFGGITVVLLVIIWLFVRTNRLKKQKVDLESLQKKNETRSRVRSYTKRSSN